MAQLAWHATPWHWPNTILSRRAATPLERPALVRGERILAVADAVGGSAAATTHALYHRRGDQPDGWVRIGWEEIETARWSPDEGTLTLTALPGSARPPVTLHLAEPGRLPAVSRDRIAATIVATRRVTIASGPALITVRRRPGTDALVWTVRLRGHADASTDGQIDRAIRTLRADLGI